MLRHSLFLIPIVVKEVRKMVMNKIHNKTFIQFVPRTWLNMLMYRLVAFEIRMCCFLSNISLMHLSRKQHVRRWEKERQRWKNIYVCIYIIHKWNFLHRDILQLTQKHSPSYRLMKYAANAYNVIVISQVGAGSSQNRPLKSEKME